MSICNMPDEIVLIIMNFLDGKSLLQFGLCEKKLYPYSREPKVLERKLFDECNIKVTEYVWHRAFPLRFEYFWNSLISKYDIPDDECRGLDFDERLCMITRDHWLDQSAMFTCEPCPDYIINEDFKDSCNYALIESLSYYQRIEPKLIDEFNVNSLIKTYTWYREFPIRFRYFWEVISHKKIPIKLQRKFSIFNRKLNFPDDFKAWCEKTLRLVSPDDWLGEDTTDELCSLYDLHLDTSIENDINDYMMKKMRDHISYALMCSMGYKEKETQRAHYQKFKQFKDKLEESIFDFSDAMEVIRKCFFNVINEDHVNKKFEQFKANLDQSRFDFTDESLMKVIRKCFFKCH
jgi:hypothetical protein